MDHVFYCVFYVGNSNVNKQWFFISYIPTAVLFLFSLIVLIWPSTLTNQLPPGQPLFYAPSPNCWFVVFDNIHKVNNPTMANFKLAIVSRSWEGVMMDSEPVGAGSTRFRHSCSVPNFLMNQMTAVSFFQRHLW